MEGPLITYQIVEPNYLAAIEAGLPPLGEGVERTIVVTGAPRTGTSMVAGLLHHAGVHMGSNVETEPQPHNEKGLYEDEKFLKLNEFTLAAAYGSWLRPAPWENFRWITIPAEPLVRYEQRAVWGFKDTRMAFVFPVWEKVLERVRPHVIVCHRNPLSAARSACRWWGLNLGHALQLVAEYEYHLARFLGLRTDWPVLHVPFESVLANPAGWARQLGRFAGVEIGETLAAEFVDPKLRHF